MRTRLVVGMHSRCMASGGYVYPLIEKSLRDILRTKRADGGVLENGRCLEEEDEEWENFYGDDEPGSIISNLSDHQEYDECIFSLEM